MQRKDRALTVSCWDAFSPNLIDHQGHPQAFLNKVQFHNLYPGVSPNKQVQKSDLYIEVGDTAEDTDEKNQESEEPDW